MNDKIKELALQAGFTEEDDGDLAVWDGMEAAGCTEELKKFAELIVRECARIIDRGDGEVCSIDEWVWCNKCRDDIIRHFGLK